LYRGYRIVGITPAGRKKTLKILKEYTLSNRDVLDEHQLWVNTSNKNDINYINSLKKTYPDFFKLVYRDEADGRSRNIFKFFTEATAPNTIYVRFDDDVVFINNLKKLLDFRIENPKYFLVFPIIINNAVCNHVLQKKGLYPEDKWPLMTFNCLGTVWKNAKVAERIHRKFLKDLRSENVDDYYFDKFDLKQRISINCMCFFGEECAFWSKEINHNEEQWLTSNRLTAICGESIVCHYSFHTQRWHLDKTDILKQYEHFVFGKKIFI
jgi:hypothetical protein